MYVSESQEHLRKTLDLVAASNTEIERPTPAKATMQKYVEDYFSIRRSLSLSLLPLLSLVLTSSPSHRPSASIFLEGPKTATDSRRRPALIFVTPAVLHEIVPRYCVENSANEMRRSEIEIEVPQI